MVFLLNGDQNVQCSAQVSKIRGHPKDLDLIVVIVIVRSKILKVSKFKMSMEFFGDA
jgi:hypothetical protein